MRTGAALLLGVGLILAAGFGLFAAKLSLDQIGHTQQGYSCGSGTYVEVCSALGAQVLIWRVVQVMSVLAFVAGVLLPILVWIYGKP